MTLGFDPLWCSLSLWQYCTGSLHALLLRMDRLNRLQTILSTMLLVRNDVKIPIYCKCVLFVLEPGRLVSSHQPAYEQDVFSLSL
jgi:hypothetical protein